jgi:hypothetical protein
VIARVLPAAEYGRLDALTGLPPFAPFFRPEDLEVLVVEDEGRIVASVAVMRVTHYEGWWIAPEYRGNAGLVRRLMKRAVTVARKWSDGWVWAFADTPLMNDLLARLGGNRLPVETFVLSLGR